MRIDILTLFPEMFVPLNESILGRAQNKGVLQINTVYIYDREKEVLLKKGETVTCKIEIPQKVSAPVLKGEKLGRIAYYLDGKLIDFYPVYAEKSVEKISFKWYTEKVFHDFFH